MNCTQRKSPAAICPSSDATGPLEPRPAPPSSKTAPSALQKLSSIQEAYLRAQRAISSCKTFLDSLASALEGSYTEGKAEILKAKNDRKFAKIDENIRGFAEKLEPLPQQLRRLLCFVDGTLRVPSDSETERESEQRREKLSSDFEVSNEHKLAIRESVVPVSQGRASRPAERANREERGETRHAQGRIRGVSPFSILAKAPGGFGQKRGGQRVVTLRSFSKAEGKQEFF